VQGHRIPLDYFFSTAYQSPCFMPHIDFSYVVRRVYNKDKEKGDVSITECMGDQG
jgi:hypothetical protein